MPTIYKKLQFTRLNNNLSRLDIENAWREFIEIGRQAELDTIVRPEIMLSWERSAGLGVNPFQEQVNKNVSSTELINWKAKNEELLHYARRDMKYLMEAVTGTETLITISDENGLLLDSYGDPSVQKEAEKINFVPGAIWSEQFAGTNAIGTVIETKKPAHIMFSEHFSVGWQDWFCAGAPILNPFTNQLMGVLDLSGKWENTNPHTLGLVVTKANSISYHLEKILYHEGLKMNPFLMTAIGSLQDGIMITDNKRNIIKSNERMNQLLRDYESIRDYPEIDQLINIVLNDEVAVAESEIKLPPNHGPYLCTVYPVKVNKNSIVGTFVRIQKSEKVNKKTFSGITLDKPSRVQYDFSSLVGSSTAFMNAVSKAKKAAELNSTILVSGETGTGKELFVQAIHQASERRDGPFVAINSGAISKDLMVSELFGYEQGAFTGANRKGNPGKFEQANGGTIFLDEIGEMPLEVQVHLLRVIEERVVTRVGGNKEIPIDVRIIAASHKNLKEAVKQGEFRADLYYRLRVIQLNLPSLRERIDDIPNLVNHFINQIKGDFGKQDITVDPQTMKLLQAYSWPGNIRELKNVVEQSLFSMDGNILVPNNLPEEITENAIEQNGSESKRALYIETIRSTNGNVSAAAKMLGISRATMYRRMKRLDITKESI